MSSIPISFSEPRVVFDNSNGHCMRIDLTNEGDPLLITTGEVYSRGIRPAYNSKHLTLPMNLYDRKLLEETTSPAYEIVPTPEQITFVEQLDAIYTRLQEYVVSIGLELGDGSLTVEDERVVNMNPLNRQRKAPEKNRGLSLVPKVMFGDGEPDLRCFDQEGNPIDPYMRINKAGRLACTIQVLSIYINRMDDRIANVSVFLKVREMNLK